MWLHLEQGQEVRERVLSDMLCQAVDMQHIMQCFKWARLWALVLDTFVRGATARSVWAFVNLTSLTARVLARVSSNAVDSVRVCLP